MPIDPSIILGVKPVNLQFQQPDPIEQYGKVASLQALLGQNKLQGMQTEKLSGDLADEQAYKNVFRNAQPGSTLESLLPELFKTSPKAAIALQGDVLKQKQVQAEIDKNRSTTNETDFKTQIAKLTHGASLIGSATDQESYDNAKRIGAMQGIFGQEALGHMPQTFDPNFVRMFSDAGMTEVQRREALARAQAAAQKNANDPFMANPIDPTKPIPNLPVQDYQLGLRKATVSPAQGLHYDPTRGVVVNTINGTATPATMNNGSPLPLPRIAPHYDSDRGVVVDTNTAISRPVTTQEGGPLPPKNSSLNDSQSKSALFGTRMLNAHNILQDLEDQGTSTSIPGANAKFGVGSTLNLALPANQQKLNQAKRDFLNAVLRRESGAVISPTEFEEGNKQYFPQIGDAESAVEQKARARELAMRGVMIEVPEAQRAKAIKDISGNNVMSQSDVEDAIKQTGKSRKEVIRAARARGYLIN